jgi:glucose-6-phosphate 1-epimerase
MGVRAMTSHWTKGVRGGLEVVELATPASTCTIALHGAQVLTFTPRGDRDWLWVSDRAYFQVGKPLRGGIPICFPWFGPHATERDSPPHGFARTRLWRLGRVDELGGQRLRAELTLAPDPAGAPLFPGAFAARLAVTAGEALELAFEVTNGGEAPFSFEVALHTYFAVGDIDAITVEGLGGCAYVDRVAGGARRHQDQGALPIRGEVDRIYDSGGPVTLVDPARARPIQVRSRAAGSTVVWNPGAEKARTIVDMSPEGFRRFVCVETANVGDRRITLRPGETHETSVRYGAGGTEGV